MESWQIMEAIHQELKGEVRALEEKV